MTDFFKPIHAKPATDAERIKRRVTDGASAGGKAHRGAKSGMLGFAFGLPPTLKSPMLERPKALTREEDDQILDFLRLRVQGVPVRDIARRFGVSGSFVDKSTRKVLAADLNESGEPDEVVKLAYWKTRAPRRAAK